MRRQVSVPKSSEQCMIEFNCALNSIGSMLSSQRYEYTRNHHNKRPLGSTDQAIASEWATWQSNQHEILRSNAVNCYYMKSLASERSSAEGSDRWEQCEWAFERICTPKPLEHSTNTDIKFPIMVVHRNGSSNEIDRYECGHTTYMHWLFSFTYLWFSAVSEPYCSTWYYIALA